MRVLLAIMWLLHWLPLPILGRLGEGVGALLFVLMRRRRRIALTNLRLCLPQFSEEERKDIAYRHFQAYARSIFERGILWWSPIEKVHSLIQIEPSIPIEHIKAGPVIVLCPHFVGLDVAGIALRQATTLSSMYSPQQNKVFDAALLRGRLRYGTVKLFTRADGIKPIIRSMREGLPFFMLPDMDFGIKNAEFVPFFGTPAATLTAPARIAAATGAKVIPVITTYLPNYKGWKVTFYPPWDDYPGGDIVEATRRMNAFIEERILERPAEYFWAHKRFKTRPPGEPSIYAKGGPATIPLEEST